MRVTLIASEGGAGYYPENTVTAVRQSLADGVDGCELDFHLTADNRFVAHHDYQLNPALARDQNGNWLSAPGPVIKNTTLNDLRCYDLGTVDPESKIARRYPDRGSSPGERIATFEDVEQSYLEHAESPVELWFEAKTDPFDPSHTTPPEQFIGELAKILPVSPVFSSTVLIAFDWRLLAIARAAMTDLHTGFLTVDFSWLPKYASANTSERTGWFGDYNPADYADSMPRAVKAAGGTYWSPYCRDLDRDTVEEAHDLGIKVSTWGANTEEEISQALATGVDSLTTGYVDRAKRILSAIRN